MCLNNLNILKERVSVDVLRLNPDETYILNNFHINNQHYFHNDSSYLPTIVNNLVSVIVRCHGIEIVSFIIWHHYLNRLSINLSKAFSLLTLSHYIDRHTLKEVYLAFV